MATDASVTFEMDMRDKKAQEKLLKLEKQIDSARKKLEEKESGQSAIKAELDAAKASANETLDSIDQIKRRLAELDATMLSDTDPSTWMEANNEAARLQERLKGLTAEERKHDSIVQRLSERYAKATDDVDKQAAALAEAKEEAGKVARKIAEAEANTRGWQGAVNKVESGFKAFEKRLVKLATRALVFSVIYSGLRKLKEYMWEVIQTDNEAMAAFAQLKGALLTLAQPLANVLIPAFTVFVKILTAVISRILQLVSLITGKSVAASSAAAKALNEQTNALSGTGSAAKKAGKSLASFDEINQLSGSEEASAGVSGADIAPDFSFLDGMDDTFQKIADGVLIIGAGFATWKVLSAIPWDKVMGSFSKIGGVDAVGKLMGIGIAIASVISFVNGLKDAWENGVDWGNLNQMLGATTAAMMALYLAFGLVAAGIALIVGGAIMIVTAFNDIITNGANLQNTLLMIGGIVATGLGFGFLCNSMIPLVIAGIAAIVVAVLELTGNLEEFMINLKENILGGLIDFLTGVFTEDWEKAWNGVKKIFAGLWNSIVILLESAINIIIKGVNWLITQLNKIHFEIPDWVPGIGGKSFGINIPKVSEVKLQRIEIPELARGAVIPPNREFMAVLGDQKSGTNIETPLATMVQAFKQALAESGYSGGNEAVLVLDREVLGKVIYKLNKAESTRIGVNLAGV